MIHPILLHPILLTFNHILLEPIEEAHEMELAILNNLENVFEHLSLDISNPNQRRQFIQQAIEERISGNSYTFIIRDHLSNQVLGSTRIMDIREKHSGCEIGWTWLVPTVWKTHVNSTCKLLLLDFCFTQLKVERVQLKTDRLNTRSQKAIERLGAVKEGILRHHMIRKDGTFRDTVLYSLVKSEWEILRIQLITKTKYQS